MLTDPKTPAMQLADIAIMMQLVLTHLDAGHDGSDPKLVTDLTTLRTDVDRFLDAIQIPPTTDDRVSFLVREIVRQGRTQEAILAEVTAVQTAVEVAQATLDAITNDADDIDTPDDCPPCP